MKKVFLENITRYIAALVLALAAIVSIWFLLNNLVPLASIPYSFFIVCTVGFIIFLKLFANNFLQRIASYILKITAYRYFPLLALTALALIGIAVRLLFYYRYSYAPLSDQLSFFDAAQKIADGHGLTGDSYPAFFPYLAAYDNILGLAMRLIHDPWLATILLNTIFDLGSAVATYFLVKKITKTGSKLPLIAFGLWLFCPLNILFSVLALPIIIVNFFIITALLVVCLLHEKLTTKNISSSLLLASLLGVVIGIGNCFRPIFTIVIVALFLLLLYILVTAKNNKRLPLLLGSSFLLVVVIFFGIQKLNLTLVAAETGFIPASNASGWSVFVGSNSDSNGTWNREDEVRMGLICKDNKNFDSCHDKLRQAGIERYKSHGLSGTMDLFIRKLNIFSGSQGGFYNTNMTITSDIESRVVKIINTYTPIFLLITFYLTARLLYLSSKTYLSKKEVSPVVVFIALILVGFFISSIFVETSPRYALIMYPLFIVLTTLSFNTPHSKKLS